MFCFVLTFNPVKRQEHFKESYSSFFVRFSNIEDAKLAKIEYSRNKTLYNIDGEEVSIETITSFGWCFFISGVGVLMSS